MLSHYTNYGLNYVVALFSCHPRLGDQSKASVAGTLWKGEPAQTLGGPAPTLVGPIRQCDSGHKVCTEILCFNDGQFSWARSPQTFCNFVGMKLRDKDSLSLPNAFSQEGPKILPEGAGPSGPCPGYASVSETLHSTLQDSYYLG